MASRPTFRCSSASSPTAASARAGRTSTTWKSSWPNARTRRCRSVRPRGLLQLFAGAGFSRELLIAHERQELAADRSYTNHDPAMPFLELTVPCRESEQPRYEHALEDVGALAVTMLDAN